ILLEIFKSFNTFNPERFFIFLYEIGAFKDILPLFSNEARLKLESLNYREVYFYSLNNGLNIEKLGFTYLFLSLIEIYKENTLLDIFKNYVLPKEVISFLKTSIKAYYLLLEFNSNSVLSIIDIFKSQKSSIEIKAFLFIAKSLKLITKIIYKEKVILKSIEELNSINIQDIISQGFKGKDIKFELERLSLLKIDEIMNLNNFKTNL
ncbi:MAG: hypothetical protein R3Y52_02430, partial [Psittacicella sp.]